MSYANDYGETPRSIPLAGKIAIAFAALLGIVFALGIGLGAYAKFTFNPEDAYEEVLKLTPEAKGFSDAARIYFPADLAEMREQAMVAINQNEKSRAQRIMVLFVEQFIKDHAKQAAAASDRRLLALLKAQAAASGFAAETREICMAGRSGAPSQNLNLSPAQSAAISLLARRYVEAAAEGRDKPMRHAQHTYSEEQFLLGKLQTQGVGRQELLIADSPTQDVGQAMRNCHVAHALHQTLLDLPPEMAVRFFASMLLAQSRGR